MELNPSSKGWIRKHHSMMMNGDLDWHIRTPKGFDNEEIIFGTIVSTGLVYGIPLHFIGVKPEQSFKWTKEERLKVLLYESLLLVYETNIGNEQVDLDEFVRSVYSFYEAIGIKRMRSILKLLSRETDEQKVESILQTRSGVEKKINNKLWVNYQTNSLIFSDVILYHLYLKHHLSQEELRDKRSSLVIAILKIISSAIHSDGMPDHAEINIYKTYLASAGLSKEEDEYFRDYFNNRVSIDEILEFPFISSWMEKRYVLETAILIIWSDQLLADEELEFLLHLTNKLDLQQHDLENCLMFIESFVLENYREIPFFTDEKTYTRIYGDLNSRFVKLLSRNKDKLATEIMESKELMQLLTKSTYTDLTKEDKKRMKDQFLDIIKTIPALAIFLLPGGMVLLPMVLKIIPTLIPSAFQNNKIEDRKND